MLSLFVSRLTTVPKPPKPPRFSWRTKLLVLLLSGVSGILVGIGWWSWSTERPLLSPLTSVAQFRFFASDDSHSSGKIVYGYIPYWNVAEAQLQPELTHTSYFSLSIAGDGSFITRQDDGPDMGYYRLGSESFWDMATAAETVDSNLELTVTQFNADTITTFLSSDTAQETFFEELDAVLLAYPFSGVNIDIEYSGTVTDRLRERYALFLERLRAHTDSRYDSITLSAAMYANAGTRYTIWDVAAIAPHVDYIVVMAYDFHRQSSVVAGPVAPVFGGRELWDSDISQNLKGFISQAPADKILLGVPFYGYEWQTTSRDAQSPTYPDSGATATYKRIQSLLAEAAEKNVQQHWNEDALSPYISYVEGGETFVIYYEDSRSLSYKLDLVNQLDLGGIAIWALGYEGDSRELWDVIGRKL